MARYSQAQVKAAYGPRCRGPWARMRIHGGAVITVDPLITEAVLALNVIAVHYDYRAVGYDNAGYVCKYIAGTNRDSKHSKGLAIDREWNENPYGSRRTDRPSAMNRAIQRVRTNNGRQVWSWGGYWSTPDNMHDEIVCLPHDLATGINWSTVEGFAKPTPVPKTPTDWAAVRRLAAASVIDGVRGAPNMGPGHTGPGPFGSDLRVAAVQKALNVVTGTKLKENGVYDAWTEGVIKNWQNFVTKVLKGPMPDPHGHFREYTRFYLVQALQNIMDGKA